ncbi:MAG: hypothetical protein Ct9H300mP30_0420 [Methanobacteriota archaeon]|nr:MAG: hypothetical protein Ct9H300mP30_0420 [Euryarchaeota archaeon]
MPEDRSGEMAKFHGFRSCITCKVNCPPGELRGLREQEILHSLLDRGANPEHPELELIRQQVIDSAEEWKCAKWTREEGPLPDGPKPARD